MIVWSSVSVIIFEFILTWKPCLPFHSRQKIDIALVPWVNTASSFRDKNYISLINWSYSYYTVVVKTPNHVNSNDRSKLLSSMMTWTPLLIFSVRFRTRPLVIEKSCSRPGKYWESFGHAEGFFLAEMKAFHCYKHIMF